MKYSIIIAVYNRLEEVKNSLKAQKARRNRCLLNYSWMTVRKDGFKEFIEQYHSATGLQIRAIPTKSRSRGCQKYGMSKAQGEYFIFVDSDCMFPSMAG